jgi:hypothetical protein
MAGHAQHVIHLLEELKRMVISHDRSMTVSAPPPPESSTVESASDVSRPPKRPWEDIDREREDDEEQRGQLQQQAPGSVGAPAYVRRVKKSICFLLLMPFRFF